MNGENGDYPVRWTIVDVTWSGEYRTFTVVVETDIPVHLTLDISYTQPIPLLTWRTIRGARWRCQVEWSFRYQYGIGQSEPGDTLIHTFEFPWHTLSRQMFGTWKAWHEGILTVSNSPFATIYSFDEGPIETIVYPLADSRLTSSQPNYNWGLSQHIPVVGPPDSGSRSRAILRFPMEGIPANAVILSATLRLLRANALADSTKHTLYRVTSQDWTELGVTWNSRYPDVPWLTPGGDYDAESPPPVITTIPSGPSFTWIDMEIPNHVHRAVYDGRNLHVLIIGTHSSRACWYYSRNTYPTPWSPYVHIRWQTLP